MDEVEERALDDSDEDDEVEDHDEIQEVEDDSESFEGDDPDEEVVVPVSYEGIPTWEEAISYLVITPPSESRGQNRGRNDGYRRDDSRRR